MSMTVFQTAYAAGYDALYATKDYGLECDVIEAAIQAVGRPVRRILDIGCGTGGHCQELARRGYGVFGVDQSEAMLAIARRKIEEQEAASPPHYLQGDASSFQISERFDAAIMMFAVVGYLNDNDAVLSALKNIRSHMEVGAPFVSDFWYGPSVLTDPPTDRVRVVDSDGRRILRATQTSLHKETHRAEVNFRLWNLGADGVTSETAETHSMRYFFPLEYEFFLSQAGFTLKSLTAFPSLDEPLSDASWNALAVAVAR
jgi:SAM-dependent methyltransferase